VHLNTQETPGEEKLGKYYSIVDGSPSAHLDINIGSVTGYLAALLGVKVTAHWWTESGLGGLGRSHPRTQKEAFLLKPCCLTVSWGYVYNWLELSTLERG
jgi:hypothetical protein